MSRPQSRGLVLVALAVVVGALAASSAIAMSANRTYVTSDCSGAAFKPHSIVLACGDAGLVVSKLQWPQWGTKKAHGAGRGEEKICRPDCAAGKVGRAAMKVILSKPRLCPEDGKRHFTKLHYKWIPAAPEGPKQGNIPLPCSLVGS
jgi:hypothetical protein